MFDRNVSISFECDVETSVEKLYEFHTDTNNLLLITPPWIATDIVSLELPLHEGSEIELDITRFGLTQRWNMKIDTLQKPLLLRDKALKSPFSSFVHHHRFEAVTEKKSRMKDEITFALPLYPLSLIVMPFIKHDISKMFVYRHQQTKKILEKKDV